MINQNYIILNDINKIINESEIINSFNNIIEIYNKMNNKNNNNEENKTNNEIIAQYEIKGDKKIKIFGNEFIKNNKNNFEFFANGNLRIIRDEIDNSFWKEEDKII